MIFLSKNGQDEYINMFAQGTGGKIVSTDDFVYEQSTEPIILRGILKHKLMQQCLKDQRTFYYMDTGYFGNGRWKTWHRIVKNNLQHTSIVERPSDRFEKLNKTFTPWKKTGRNILLALPDEKPCKFYGIDRDRWIEETVNTIKKYTDRPIVLRERAAKRIDRVQGDTLESALAKDVFALVTFNSIAAVESIFFGIPVFTLAPANAASPVGLQDLNQIESPYYASKDKLHAWACHLAYGQYHVDELRSGYAKELMEESI